MAVYENQPYDPKRRKCVICSGRASAYWMGTHNIPVCGECAQTKLGLLFAEAVLGTHRFDILRRETRDSMLREALARFEANAWRAAMYHAEREGQNNRDDEGSSRESF